MTPVEVRPFPRELEPEARALEDQCVQGNALQLRFVRSSFLARADCYEGTRLLGAWKGDRLVGVTAHAVKRVRFGGEDRAVSYHFDLRVHPDFRRQGIGHQLTREALRDVAAEAPYGYVMVAGQNVPMLGLVDRHYESVTVPFLYSCLPVMGPRRAPELIEIDQATARETCLDRHPATFVSDFEPDRMAGLRGSYQLADGSAACSIWTNADIIAEQIVRQPLAWRIAGSVSRGLSRVSRVPALPATGEVVRSWFMYDVSADSERALQSLVDGIILKAAHAQQQLVYVLLQVGDARLTWLRRIRRLAFRLPYQLILRGGGGLPAPTESFYIDIRDL